MVEGARLESVYTLIAYRGFESLSLRHFQILKGSPLFRGASEPRATRGFQFLAPDKKSRQNPKKGSLRPFVSKPHDLGQASHELSCIGSISPKPND